MKISAKFLSAVIAVFIFFLVNTAIAATRTAYFSISASNHAESAPGVAQQARCLVSVANTSSKYQDMTISFDGSKSTGVGAGAVVTGNTTTYSNVAPGISKTAEYVFTTYPAGSTGDQNITCTGYVSATDHVTTEIGFVNANGSLTTFYQSGSGGAHWGATASFTQNPIIINGGKSF